MKSLVRAGVVVAVVATAACGGGEAPKPAAGQAASLAVTIGHAETRPVAETSEAGGVVRSADTAIVASQVMGTAVEVHVSPGDRVTRGSPLVTLDGRELRAADARAAASVQAATDAARAADAQVTAAEAALRLATVSHERITGLHDARSATTQELDQAVAQLRSAEAQLAAARAQAAAAAAARDAAKAGAEAATVAASHAVLRAPFDGVVASRSLDPGSLVMPGVPLLVLEDPRAMRLEATVDAARAAHVTRGAAVEIAVDDRPGDWQTATVQEVGRVDPASHTFLVKVSLPRGTAARSGMFGRLRVPGPPRLVVTVPSDAVVTKGQLSTVFVVDTTRTAQLRPVSLGATAGDYVEVLAGLQQGERVVLQPPPGLRDGAAVTERAQEQVP